jgi:5'-phosphate synthase pdxT subunit
MVGPSVPGNGNSATIGILAVQGDFALHAALLDRLGVRHCLVKHPAQLHEIQGLILPGGESTTMLKFFGREKLGHAIGLMSAEGKPVFGTCAGAILLAKEILNSRQERLGLMDIAITRNAYGRQIDSAVRWGECPALSPEPVEMVFIRAPIIQQVGPEVRVLGRCGGLPVLVEEKNCLGATFHPELSSDTKVHEYFIAKVKRANGR